MSVKYGFGNNGEFILEGYDRAKTFAGFLPGIAGVWGIPMWSFYVNRGQAMGSFGVRDKNGAIMEFFPASVMYRNIERQGFRTFVRKGGRVHELFSSISDDDCTRTLVIEKNRLQVVETNHTLGLKAAVTYFTLPGEDYAAIVRKVELTNLAGQAQEIEILDGLPQILPYGIANAEYQAMANLIKAWFDVSNLENGIACYKVRASTGDTAEVREVTQGNFYLAFSSESSGLIPPIFDMDVIFAGNTALSRADGWDCPLERLYERKQVPQNKVSGGFAGAKVFLDHTFTLCSVIGHAANPELINAKKDSFSVDYVNRKEAEAINLTEELIANTRTHTSSPLFDQYIAQCSLDNLLRGGTPLLFKAKSGNYVYHVFSRKHGDLEREYNFFSLEPCFYSQGNGSYRDVNQNRRSDVLLNPTVRDANVKQFMSLLQADGYNPLLVKGCTFRLDAAALPGILQMVSSHRDEVETMLKGSFSPGELMSRIAECGAGLALPREAFLVKVLENAELNFEAEFGEGYWSDHWTYNMDLMDSYLAVYPDDRERFLFDDSSYRFFQSPVFVRPRSEKYMFAGGNVRQYGAIQVDESKHGTDWLRTRGGAGNIYETNLFAKLLALAIVKFAMLDPAGLGIEMEAGRPGWNDALNGLPGLFGSGLAEAAELKRLVSFLLDACIQFDREIPLFTEAAALLCGIMPLLEENLTGSLSDFAYWDSVSSLREVYRAKVRCGISGEEVRLGTKDLLPTLRAFSRKLDRGLEQALQEGFGIHPTYFTYEATGYEYIDDRANTAGSRRAVRMTAFERHALPPFLEGPARVMKILTDRSQSEKLYDSVKASEIYDRKLKMYKTSAPLGETSREIGRLKAFTPGWLERESVFLHMEYKYLVSLLKAGLYRQFFDDMTMSLIPFLNPELYGRSTLENSSFLASSANPDASQHGRGFVARLTGSTAEMLSIWFMMMAGNEPFFMEDCKLNLRLSPILPGWLFDENGRVGFTFLGQTKVTYINAERADTFGETGAKPARYVLRMSSGTSEVTGPVLAAPWAEMVRNGAIDSIDVYLQRHQLEIGI